MENILIRVKDQTAKQWNEAPPKLKERLEQLFEEHLIEATHQIKLMKFDRLLEKISAEAKANGLTDEILQDLLKEE